jgi:hypothetical protein
MYATCIDFSTNGVLMVVRKRLNNRGLYIVFEDYRRGSEMAKNRAGKSLRRGLAEAWFPG